MKNTDIKNWILYLVGILTAYGCSWLLALVCVTLYGLAWFFFGL